MNARTNYIKFELVVRDFGCGIQPQNLLSLFSNFSSLEEHKDQNPQGRGLGLSICKSIVEQMGGSLRVESTVGSGSSFILSLKAKTHH